MGLPYSSANEKFSKFFVIKVEDFSNDQLQFGTPTRYIPYLIKKTRNTIIVLSYMMESICVVLIILVRPLEIS